MKPQIEEFVKKWQEKYDDYMSQVFPTNPNPRLEISYGRKYAKVTREHGVEAFIDLNTGDIFKAATWAAPAHGVRGNVNSDQNGLEALDTGRMHPHIRYLK